MQPRNILQLVAFTLFSFSLNATTFTFTGPGFWDETEYWDQYPGYIITEFDTVIINERCIISPDNKLVNNGTFISNQEAIIEVIGDFENNGLFLHTGMNAYFGITNNGVLTNTGRIEVSSTFDVWISATLFNYGDFVTNDAVVKNLSKFENLGFMDIGLNTTFLNFKNFVNIGSELNLRGSFINQNNNASIENITNFTLFDNSEIELNGPMFNDGELKGSGTITGTSTFINKGILNPGFSPGLVTFNNAALIDSNSAKTIIEIGGNTPVSYDQILGTAPKTLNGTLSLRFENGFIPANGDMFSILEGPLNGAFSRINVIGIDSNTVIELFYTPTGIEIVVGSPLPLDLISFEVKESDKIVKLEWETQNEIDFHGYVIERSTNQREWQEIQFLASKNETGNNQYKFQDNSAKVGSNYYRLKMINLDESFEYSKVEHVKLSEEKKVISIYPNPFVEQIYFNQIEAQNYEIYSDKGELVKTGFANNVNMMDFSSGKYYLKLGTQTIPIIKIK